MLYAVLPVLIIAALRGGTRAVTLAGVGVAFATDWAAVTGRVDQLIAQGTEGQHLVFVQIALAVQLLSALVLAVEVADRRRVEAHARRADLERAGAERMALEIADAERRHLTRETHDVVGHALGVMLLQAGAARRMLDDDTARTREFLESIESVGRSAFRDLDAVLAVAPRPADGRLVRDLDSIPSLVDTMKAAGLDVSITVVGDCDDIPSVVQWSAYRIVQEALTNVAKHAPRARAHVSIAYEPGAVRVAVTDDGPPVRRPQPARQGRGIIGMAERVAALGGQIDVGRRNGGFAVVAELPVHEDWG
jgi:signal transduction histidine kinase